MAEDTLDTGAMTAEAETPKPRRKRRTKAEMEAARAAEAAEKEAKAAARAAKAAEKAAKQAEKEKTAEQAAASGDAPAPAKRRPGRPRKVKPADGAAPEAPAAAAPSAPTEASVAVTAAEPASAPQAEQAAPEQPAEKAPARRRRGRPRKDATEPAAVPTAEPAIESGAPAPAEPERPSIDEMTRLTAEATHASAEPTPFPATTLVETGAEAGESAGFDRAADAQEQQEGSSRRRRHNRSQNNQQGGNQQNNQQGGNQQNNQFSQNRRQNNVNRRRNRRGQDIPEPTLTREELEELKVAELRSKAAELGVDYVGVRKPELIDAIYDAAARAEGFRTVDGILEIGNEGYGWVRTGNYMEGDDDAFVHQQLIKSFGLRPGDRLVGTVSPSRTGNKYPPLSRITSVNGRDPETMRNRPRFRDLTPIFPDERLTMENGRDSITGRAIDLVAPIGKGQRGLIVSPPKAGKTTVLKKICQSIAANNPEVHLFCLLVDERPEEVTDMERSIRGTVVSSTFDMPAENHTHVAELVIEHAKRLVELGEDVVVVLDSITRLARAYNLAAPASGRILSGGVDSAALYPPKKFLGAARNIEGGGSLTILASALVDTGSKMDEVIFEEFKGTGNMELKLDRDLADRRIFPAIDPVASGTRNEDLLINPELQPFIWGIRRILANMNNTERAASALVKGLKSTNTNEEFLIRSAKKAQQTDYVGM